MADGHSSLYTSALLAFLLQFILLMDINSFFKFPNRRYWNFYNSFFSFSPKGWKFKYLRHLWSNHCNFFCESSYGIYLQVSINPTTRKGQPREHHLSGVDMADHTGGRCSVVNPEDTWCVHPIVYPDFICGVVSNRIGVWRPVVWTFRNFPVFG